LSYSDCIASDQESQAVTTIAPLAKQAAIASKPADAAANALSGNIDFKTSLTQMPLVNDSSGSKLVNDAIQPEEAGSLIVLMAIVLGILSGALLAAVLTIALSR
jgi:hypothetical protein